MRTPVGNWCVGVTTAMRAAGATAPRPECTARFHPAAPAAPARRGPAGWRGCRGSQGLPPAPRRPHPAAGAQSGQCPAASPNTPPPAPHRTECRARPATATAPRPGAGRGRPPGPGSGRGRCAGLAGLARQAVPHGKRKTGHLGAPMRKARAGARARRQRAAVSATSCPRRDRPRAALPRPALCPQRANVGPGPAPHRCRRPRGPPHSPRPAGAARPTAPCCATRPAAPHACATAAAACPQASGPARWRCAIAHTPAGARWPMKARRWCGLALAMGTNWPLWMRGGTIN